jgi:hypothetical protein
MTFNLASRSQVAGVRTKIARTALAFLGMCASLAATAHAASSVYVVSITQEFGIVNLDNGSFTPIGNGTPDGLANLVWMPDGALFTLVTTGNQIGYLARINPANGKETPTHAITYQGQPLGANAFSLAAARGRLYVTDFSNNLYVVDPHTGVANTVGKNGGATGLRADPNVPFSTNADGTLNLCDEGLYEFDGDLYATFDSFALDLTQTPPVRAHDYLAPYVWKINPATGAATFLAQTDWQIGAIVQVNGRFYAFKGVLDGSQNGFPIAHTELDSLDINTGKTTKIADLDANLGLVIGAAPVHDPYE